MSFSSAHPVIARQNTPIAICVACALLVFYANAAGAKNYTVIRAITPRDWYVTVTRILDPPPPPSQLVATNGASPEREFPSYAVDLTWLGTPGNGYIVFRAFNPAAGTAPLEFSEVARLHAATAEYRDVVAASRSQDDQYCYRLASFKNNPIVSGDIIESQLSNIACSYFHPNKIVRSPDTDGDGWPDDRDCCADRGSVYGCLDVDEDGFPDGIDTEASLPLCAAIADRCPGLSPYVDLAGLSFGDTYTSDDHGPQSPPGCPIKYKLTWIGMEVLNNSAAMVNPGFAWPPDRNEIPGDHGANDDGEEPYLMFSQYIGQDLDGHAGIWTKQWCCGSDINVEANRKEVNPGSDGFTIFGQKGDFAVINRMYGLTVDFTLMERDWKRNECFRQQENAWGELLGAVGGFGSAAMQCVFTGGVGCGEPIAKAFRSAISQEIGKSFADNKLLCYEVDDPDDFMGTNSWWISRNGALRKTRETGAYGFSFEMPTTNRLWRPGGIVGGGGWLVENMRAQISMCLYREGLQMPIKQACSPLHKITEAELLLLLGD